MTEKSFFNTFFGENKTLFTIIALFAGLSSYCFTLYKESANNSNLLSAIMSLYFLVLILCLILYFKTLQATIDFIPEKIFQKAIVYLAINLLLWAIIDLGLYFYFSFSEKFTDLSVISLSLFVYIFVSGIVLFLAYKIPSIEGCRILRKCLAVGCLLASFVAIIFWYSPLHCDILELLILVIMASTFLLSILYVSVRIQKLEKLKKK